MKVKELVEMLLRQDQELEVFAQDSYSINSPFSINAADIENANEYAKINTPDELFILLVNHAKTKRVKISEQIIQHDVYQANVGELFSSGVQRDFGENRTVCLFNGEVIFAAVLPLKCDPVECELTKIGYI